MSNVNLNEMLGKPVAHYKEGRICKFPGCKTIMNIYNPNKYCHFHTSKMVIRSNELNNQSMHWKRHSIYGGKDKANAENSKT